MKSDSTTVIKNMEFLERNFIRSGTDRVLLRHPLLFHLRK